MPRAARSRRLGYKRRVRLPEFEPPRPRARRALWPFALGGAWVVGVSLAFYATSPQGTARAAPPPADAPARPLPAFEAEPLSAQPLAMEQNLEPAQVPPEPTRHVAPEPEAYVPLEPDAHVPLEPDAPPNVAPVRRVAVTVIGREPASHHAPSERPPDRRDTSSHLSRSAPAPRPAPPLPSPAKAEAPRERPLRAELDSVSAAAPAAPLAPVGEGTSRGGGPSCEAAIAVHRETIEMGAGRQAPDLPDSAFSSRLDDGAYFAHCAVPANVRVRICAAVQRGRAVGVTVRTEPASQRIGRCVETAVRGLRFPSHPRLDVARTTFEPM